MRFFLAAKTSLLSQLTKIRYNIRLQIEEFAAPHKIHDAGGYSLDPTSIITPISTGLKLVDQFREFAIRVRGQAPSPPSGKAEQVGTALEVRQGGQVAGQIDAKQLNLNQWNVVRYEALSQRIRTNWDILNDLFSNEAGASAQEGARIKADMRHYQLYEVCQS